MSIPGLNIPITGTRRFLDWSKLKRFGVDRDRKIFLKNWNELYPLYVKNKSYLYDTKKITLEHSKSPVGNAGSRNFKAYSLPPLRYWNPDVEFEVIVRQTGNPKFTIEKLNGQIEEFSATNMKEKGILQKIKDICIRSTKQ